MLLIFGAVLVPSALKEISDGIYDSMFIDGTEKEAGCGPLRAGIFWESEDASTCEEDQWNGFTFKSKSAQDLKSKEKSPQKGIPVRTKPTNRGEDIFIFNVTNPEEASKGAKIILQELEPLYMDNWAWGAWTDEEKIKEGICSQRLTTYWKLRLGVESHTKLDDVIIVPHHIYTTIVEQKLDNSVADMKNGFYPLFVKTTVRSLLGMSVDVDDPMTKFANQLLNLDPPLPGFTLGTHTESTQDEGPISAYKCSSKFGMEGLIRSWVFWNGAGQEMIRACPMDKDCKLADPQDINSCTIGGNCNPPVVRGGQGMRLPSGSFFEEVDIPWDWKSYATEGAQFEVFEVNTFRQVHFMNTGEVELEGGIVAHKWVLGKVQRLLDSCPPDIEGTLQTLPSPAPPPPPPAPPPAPPSPAPAGDPSGDVNCTAPTGVDDEAGTATYISCISKTCTNADPAIIGMMSSGLLKDCPSAIALAPCETELNAFFKIVPKGVRALHVCGEECSEECEATKPCVGPTSLEDADKVATYIECLRASCANAEPADVVTLTNALVPDCPSAVGLVPCGTELANFFPAIPAGVLVAHVCGTECSADCSGNSTESSSVEGPDSPGYDCNGPPNTLRVGLNKDPSAMPVYLSLPYFSDNAWGLETDTNDGQSKDVQQDLHKRIITDRIEILKCTKSPECGGDRAITDIAIYSDVITGMVIKANQALMGNWRVTSGSTLFPQFEDALIPVFIRRDWADIAIHKDAQNAMKNLQSLPDQLGRVQSGFIGAGAALLVIGLAACVFSVVTLKCGSDPAQQLAGGNQA